MAAMPVRHRLAFLVGVLTATVALAVLRLAEIPVGSTVALGLRLLDRQPLGSLFVPWEAGAAAEPTTSGVKLRVGRPDLIVKRGLRPGTAIRTGADRGFTAWAVNLYTARPDFRPAVGTLEGLRQLVPPPPDPA